MISEEEKALIRTGVKKAIEFLHANLHSEDDHGYDLYRWLEKNEEKIVEEAYGDLTTFYKMVVD